MDKIYGWFENYKKRFKIISVKKSECEFLDSTSENHTPQKGYTIRIYSNVLEDLGIILSKFRYYPGISMPNFEEYDFSDYNPGINPFDVSYESLEDIKNIDFYPKNCNMAFEISRKNFAEFWKEFTDFCSEWNFMWKN